MRSNAMKRTATAKVESADHSEVFILHFLILQSSCKDKTLREAAKNSVSFVQLQHFPECQSHDIQTTLKGMGDQASANEYN